MENDKIIYALVGRVKDSIKAGTKNRVDVFFYGDDNYIVGVSTKGGPSVLIERIFREYDEAHSFALKEAEKIKAGPVPDNYSGKTAEQIWNAWNEQQREHFMNDHDLSRNYDETDWQFVMSGDFGQMDRKIKEAVIEHISEGQYGKGGIIKTVLNFLNQKIYFNK